VSVTDPSSTATGRLGPYSLAAGADGRIPGWNSITAPTTLADKSGVGTYTTIVTLPSDWTSDHGAYLNLGSVLDTVRVNVNGQDLPPVNFSDLSRIDIGPYLHEGDNTIEVRVASTLLNAVRVAPNTGAQNRARQNYGLMGPVQFIPYGQATIQPGKQRVK